MVEGWKMEARGRKKGKQLPYHLNLSKLILPFLTDIRNQDEQRIISALIQENKFHKIDKIKQTDLSI
jgi:hypothetical protein